MPGLSAAPPSTARENVYELISAHHPAALSELEQILALTNQFRAANGAGPLTIDAPQADAAEKYAALLAVTPEFSHYLNGTTPSSRDQAAGFQGDYIGENIARGFGDPQSVMTAWENSPGHRRNLLDPNFNVIGIGIAGGPQGKSWVQDFGRMTGPPPPPPPEGKFELVRTLGTPTLTFLSTPAGDWTKAAESATEIRFTHP